MTTTPTTFLTLLTTAGIIVETPANIKALVGKKRTSVAARVWGALLNPEDPSYKAHRLLDEYLKGIVTAWHSQGVQIPKKCRNLLRQDFEACDVLGSLLDSLDNSRKDLLKVLVEKEIPSVKFLKTCLKFMQEYTNATALIFAVECYKASEDCDFSEFFEAHFAELNSAINHPKDVNERTELILLFQSHSQSAHAIKSIFSACLTVNNQAEANLLAKIFLCHDHLGDSIRNKLLKIFSEYPDFWPNLSKGAMFINDLEGHEPNELISFEGLLDYLESSQGSETIRRWYQLMLEINFNFPIFRHFKAAYEAECLESFMNAYENLPDQDKEDQLAVGRLYRQMTED